MQTPRTENTCPQVATPSTGDSQRSVQTHESDSQRLRSHPEQETGELLADEQAAPQPSFADIRAFVAECATALERGETPSGGTLQAVINYFRQFGQWTWEDIWCWSDYFWFALGHGNLVNQGKFTEQDINTLELEGFEDDSLEAKVRKELHRYIGVRIPPGPVPLIDGDSSWAHHVLRSRANIWAMEMDT